MIHVSGVSVWRDAELQPHYTARDPIALADEVATKMYTARYGTPQTLFEGRVMLLVQNWGRDFHDHDYKIDPDTGEVFLDPVTQEAIPNTSEYAIRFFRADDRLPASDGRPAMTDLDFPNTPGHADWGTARSYRHPFIKAAESLPANNPLKAWTIAFATRLKDIHDNQNLPGWVGQQLPYLERVAFDVEAPITLTKARNGVKMLDELARRPSYWNRQLPGYPVGTSLATLYNAEIGPGGSGFPDNLPDGTPGILTTGVGISDTIGDAYDIRNRRFMVWAYRIYQRVTDAITNNAGYEPLRAAFPGVICGNYDDGACDGVTDSTGWMQDAFGRCRVLQRAGVLPEV
jgi:hypothetical protein